MADTREALLRLAGYYRQFFQIPVVGLTGSVGKTTTKEMTAAVLSKRYKTLKNEGNLNNEIGMPMTAFGLDLSYGAAVFEMGMSGFGEIARMARAAAPTVGIITNIGVSHMEQLGSRENIRKAKLELLEIGLSWCFMNKGENMLFGLLEGDMLLIIGAVLSLMTMLLFWRVKKNSLQLAESSGKLRTLMHMPYRQVRRSIQGKLGAHKLFLLFLLLVFAVAFFLWLYMQW